MAQLSQAKLKRMARVLRWVIQVFFWFTAIAAVGGVVAAVVIYFIPADTFIPPAGQSMFKLTMGGVLSYEVETPTTLGVSVKPIFLAIAPLSVLCFAGLAIIFRQISALLKTVEIDQPFAEENAKRVTIIGVILILGSIFVPLAGGLVAYSIIETFHPKNFSVNFGADSMMLFAGFLMLIFGGIFRYGHFLQQEYDSTL